MVDIKVVTFAVIFAGLIGAIVWDLITWYFGLPTSSSHALIGGYAGAAVAKAGFGAIIAVGLDQDADLHRAGAAHRPGARASLLMVAILLDLPRTSRRRASISWFRRLQLLSAAAYSLGHGGNDAQKTMGIIAGALFAGGYSSTTFTIPFWVDPGRARRDRARHAVGRLAHHPHDGLEDHQAAAGRRLRRRDRRRRSRSSPPRISASRSAPRTRSPAPSSASARSRRLSAVRWGVAGRIVWAWVLTIPASAAHRRRRLLPCCVRDQHASTQPLSSDAGTAPAARTPATRTVNTAPPSRAVRGADRAAVQLDEVLDDGQAEARCRRDRVPRERPCRRGRSARRRAADPLPECRARRRRPSSSDAVAVARGAHDDRAAFGRVVDGVLEQVAQRRRAASPDRRDTVCGVGRDVAARPAAVAPRSAAARSASTPSNSAATVQATRSSVSWPGVEPRQPQQVAHQPLHPQRVPRDDLEEAPRRRRRRRRRRAALRRSRGSR